MLARANVPCGGCRACCRNDRIILHPEHGDDPASFEIEPTWNPLTNRPALMLKHKPNGDCIYLGEEGCTIHDRAPAICREFDCRRFFMKFSRAERRAGVSRGLLTKAILDAGRERMRSLDAPA